MEAEGTKEKILEAAEKLFAENGFAATSLRRITAAADANLAAVNYYFGSKEELIRDIFARRLAAVNRERIDLLHRLERESGGEPPPLEEILRAFVTPMIRMKRMKKLAIETFPRLMMRIHSEPDDAVRKIFIDQLRAVLDAFLPAMSRSLPDLSEREILSRMRFAVGAMVHSFASVHIFHSFFGDRFPKQSDDEFVDSLVAFMAAGIRQRPAGTERRGS